MGMVAIVLGWFLLVTSALRVGMAVYVVQELGLIRYPRYLGSKTTGEVIDQAMYVAAFGLIFVLLGQIARKVLSDKGTSEA